MLRHIQKGVHLAHSDDTYVTAHSQKMRVQLFPSEDVLLRSRHGAISRSNNGYFLSGAGYHDHSDAEAEWQRLCRGNKYAGTLRLLNSAIVKISKISSLQPLYTLASSCEPLIQAASDAASLLKTDSIRPKPPTLFIVGGVVRCSADKALVVRQARGCVDQLALQLDTTSVGRAADLSLLCAPGGCWPFVFPPLTPFEVSGHHVHGSLALLQLRVAATAEWQQAGQARLLDATSPPPDGQWAAALLGCSSEYDGELWAASQLLGPPKVYPAYGDISGAWAPAGSADCPIECSLASPPSLQLDISPSVFPPQPPPPFRPPAL